MDVSEGRDFLGGVLVAVGQVLINVFLYLRNCLSQPDQVSARDVGIEVISV